MTTYLANFIELGFLSGLIAVEAAGRWLLLLGDPKK